MPRTLTPQCAYRALTERPLPNPIQVSLDDDEGDGVYWLLYRLQLATALREAQAVQANAMGGARAAGPQLATPDDDRPAWLTAAQLAQAWRKCHENMWHDKKHLDLALGKW